MSQFIYEFEELPLSVLPGIEAGLINGAAEIEYSRQSGEWQIKAVSLEGYKKLTLAERAAGKKPWVYVEAPPAVAGMISARLENEWRERVESTIGELIEQDRESAAEDRADMRRDDRMAEVL